MSVSRTHILRQTPVIAALFRTAALAAARSAGLEPREQPLPGPTLTATVGPRSPKLIRDYIRAVGGETSWYRGQVPAHLFPQWGFPLFSKTLRDIPYDMTRVLNAGCKMEIHAPIPARERLHLRASLEDIDDDGRRAILTQRLITGTDSEPEALTSWMYAFVPLKGGSSGGKKKKKKKRSKPRVPAGASEIQRFAFTPETAWEFAVLTGDFNPVHWVAPYARAAGFSNTILHGFATLAFAIEALNRVRFAGNPHRLASIDVKFTRPLVLPREVGLYLDGEGGLYVGDSAGGPAYLTGTFATR